MNKTKNIVFIGFLPGFGGAERSMFMIANGLARLGHKVTIISLMDNNIVYDLDERVDYRFIPDKEGIRLFSLINRFFALRKTLISIRPEIAISFWLQPAIFAAFISKFIGFKTIYSERGDPGDKEYSGILGLIRNLSFKMIDGFVFQTQGAKRYFTERIQNKSIVINNSVSIKFEDYPTPKIRRKAIVNVGRLHEQKNQEILIRAFGRVSDNFPGYYLEIYGDGQLKSKLEEIIKELKLTDKVILKGTTNNLHDEILDASLFVLSSDYEGMPNALMEAMALGIPSISTDCKPGGARELIDNGINGLLIERNSVSKLAEGIRYMIENQQQSERMGTTAKEICHTHTEERVIKKWEEYISRIS